MEINEINKINMHNHKSEGSKIYSGRDLGIEVRDLIDLDSKDKDDNKYNMIFPDDTVSINSSYFGGLFETSIIKLGREKFLEKYNFIYADGKELKDALQRNIDEGIDDALKEF
ncbi:hypothetical protein R2R35_19745 [Anaerocolumna sp. AGMB13020]|uniref:hypothetical protein n=1 Tax=Anaerocolumna sp. AGMB13020 TaxID=3081750 RepID=UPI002953E80A|nr:hypothetical protein [Anaerocolumna sp. AGMB13020]WOO36006.1 hypothetical protein R2R35_19745 [Anaerocolumna sp. AGMB13020]